MRKSLLVASRNKGKIMELKRLLAGIPIEILTLDDFPGMPDVEENGETFLQNATKKALAAACWSRLTTLADDSGLVVDALNGAPGVYSARFAGAPRDDYRNNMKLLYLLHDIPFAKRTARFICAVAVATPQGKIYQTEGKCEGIILRELKGEGGFGYDPLFYIPLLGRTMAQLSAEEKDQISHRGRALTQTVQVLKSIFNINK